MRFLCALLWTLPLAASDLAVAPQSLSFAYQFRSSLITTQGIVITTPQSLVFTASRPPEHPWLILPSGATTFSGTAPAILPITIAPDGLTLGTFTSAVTLRFAEGTITVPVTVLVTAAPVLGTSPGAVIFDGAAIASGTLPFQNIAVGLSSGEPFLTTTTTTVPWLTVQGTTSQLLVSASPGKAGLGLSAGALQIRGSSVLFVANNPLQVAAIFMGSGLSSLGPLTISPAALKFQGAGTQNVAVTGGAFTASSDAKWLTAAVSGQNLAVSANPADMAAGTYQGTITLFSAGILQMLPVTLTVTAAVPPVLSKVVNAASYADGAISPGEVVAIFGSSLGPATLTGLTLDAGGAVSNSLAGVQVLFNGVAAPLIYVSATQLAAVVPYDVDGKTSATVQVSVNGLTSNMVTAPVATAAPGIFTADASGQGPAALLRTGDILSIYLTGEGQTTPPGVNGKVTGDPPLPRLPVTVTIDGQPAVVRFAGEAPGIVSGVLQVNAEIPVGVRAGAVPLAVSIGGAPSQSGVTVSVR